MTIQQIVQTQRDFSGGELDPRARRRDDTQIGRAGMLTCRNMRILPAGPVTRRDGFQLRWTSAGRVGEALPTPTRPFWIEFLAGKFIARPLDNPSVIHTEITSCPWTAEDLPGLFWDASGTTVVVTHADGSMQPQVFTYSLASDTWTRADFDFDLNFNDEKRQPYHRFPETLGITMAVSGRTGSVTVTFSDDVLIEASSAIFPSVDNVALTEVDTPTTTHAIDIPGEGEAEEGEEEGEEAGDILLAIVGVRRSSSGSAPSFDVPSGWAHLENRSTADFRQRVFWKIADGMEGASFNVTTNVNACSASIVYRISNHGGEVASTIDNDDGDDPNSDNLSTPWAASPTLWIIAATIPDDDEPLAAPDNYSDLVQAFADGSGGDVTTAAATRQLTAQSEDPDEFGGNWDNDWIASTIAIKSVDQTLRGHVGARFIYVNKELEITAISSATSGTAMVIDELPPSQALESDPDDFDGESDDYSGDFSGFAVGEIVEGEESGARGEVVSKSNSENIVVQLYTQYNGFQVGERLIGPKSVSHITATGNPTGAPQAILNWKEELVNDLHGWPGSVTFDRQRLILSKLRQFPQAILWSASRTLANFAITADPDSAIFEYVPGDVSVEMVAGGPDEFAFTTDGIYYIPISSANPLLPGSVEFRLVSAESAAPVKPHWMPQGLVFASGSRDRVHTLVPTGQTARPYLVEDISQFHDHLIEDVVEIAVVASGAASVERTIYLVMGDGTMALARYDRSQEWVGWFPWDFSGLATGVVARGSRLLVTFQHAALVPTSEGEEEEGEEEGEEGVGHAAVSSAEELIAGLYLDTVILKDDTTNLAKFAGETVSLWGGDRYFGTGTINADGTLDVGLTMLPGDAYAGFAYTPAITPFAPNVGEGESIRQRMRRRKIARMMVSVHESNGFTLGSKVIPNYLAGENQEAVPTKRTTSYAYRPLGRGYDPQVAITQPIPGDLTIVEVSMEVSV